MTRTFKPGDAVIYRMTKRSACPGPRAANIFPAEHGETYLYTVDKFWRVEEVLPDGKLVLKTRRGKTHVIDADDPCVRKPGFLARVLKRDRFPDTQTKVR